MQQLPPYHEWLQDYRATYTTKFWLIQPKLDIDISRSGLGKRIGTIELSMEGHEEQWESRKNYEEHDGADKACLSSSPRA